MDVLQAQEGQAYATRVWSRGRRCTGFSQRDCGGCSGCRKESADAVR